MASSDGEVLETFENPRPYAAALRRLRRAQRAVSRCQRGSRNRRKAVVRLERVHRRVGAIRRDAAEKASTAVARRVAEVGLETLNVRGMVRRSRPAADVDPRRREKRRRRRMARPVLDAGMSRVVSVVERKVGELGGCRPPGPVAVSVVAHVLGLRLEDGGDPAGVRGPPGSPLALRALRCLDHDRDVNAARNLDPAVWRDPVDAGSQPESVNACGGACQAASAAGGSGESGSAIARTPMRGDSHAELGARHEEQDMLAQPGARPSAAAPAGRRQAFSRSRFTRALAGFALGGATLLGGAGASAQTTLLDGTLTVGSREDGDYLGYSRLVTDSGSLNVSREFTVDGHTYAIDRLEVNTSANPDQLEFVLKGSGWLATGAGGHAERKRWVLYWNNQAFPLDAPADSTAVHVEWTDNVPSTSDGATVFVRLIRLNEPVAFVHGRRFGCLCHWSSSATLWETQLTSPSRGP